MAKDSTKQIYNKIDETNKEIHEVNLAIVRLEGKIDSQVQQDDQHNIDLMQQKEDLRQTDERVDNIESFCDRTRGALQILYVAGGMLTALFVLAQVFVMIYK